MSDESQQQERSVPETSEGLVSLAQEYFSREFPNSGRGCPSPSEIAQQIESGQLPDNGLRKHLLACSSCFVTYRECLQKSRDMQPALVPLRRRIADFLHNPWMRVLVPSLPVLLLAVVAFYLRPTNSHQNVTSVNPPVELVNANANAVTTASPSPVQIDSLTQLDRGTHVARVDLRNYSPRRGSETGAEPPPLQIEQKQTAFTITLPEDSPPGAYSVSILDAFGKQIRTRTPYSADGKRLRATFDLDNLRSRNYRLCVSRSDEPPNCYPIVITNRGK
jgi:hypothetical protein